MDFMRWGRDRWSSVYPTTVPYRIDLPVSGDDIFDRLVGFGALDIEVADGSTAALMPDSVTPDQLRAALGDAITISPAIARDAGSVWMLEQRPLHVGTLHIVPADMASGPGTVRLIDAPAFGTGHHPTTALCLEILCEIVEAERPESMLDVGTGSGVLALAALTLGVPRAVGVDLDEDALRTASENARLNGLADRLELVHGGPQDVDDAWPLVVANILAAPLIDMASSLVRTVGHRGRLLLSGIPQSLEEDVVRAYRHLGMHRVEVRTSAGWTAVVMRTSW